MEEIRTKVSNIKTDKIDFGPKTQQRQYVRSNNSLERNLEKDKFEKKEKTKLITFGTIAALAVAAGIEFFAFKGKHFDDIISKIKNKKTKPGEKPKIEESPKSPKVEPKNKGTEELTAEGKAIEETIPEIKAAEEIIPEGKAIEKTIPEIKAAEEIIPENELIEEINIEETVYEIIPEKNSKIRTLWDKITSKFKNKKPKEPSEHAEVLDIPKTTKNSKEIDGKNLRIEKVKIEQPKLIQGIDRSKYPKSYTQDSCEITEELFTTSEGHEYINKTIKKDGNVIKEIYTQKGSIKTHYEEIYENGVNNKVICYKEDGTTIDYISILDKKGNVIERHLYENGNVNIVKCNIPKPKLIQGIDRSKYPKSYTQDSCEITEELFTTSEGHEYINKTIKKDGNVIKEIYTQKGSIKTHYEEIYENGVNNKVIWYKEDGTTIDYISILDKKGNVIERQYPV